MEDELLLRYSRQILLPEIDVAGQIQLIESSVLLLGLGGLGCPLLTYLVASGVGRIGIVDFGLMCQVTQEKEVPPLQEDLVRTVLQGFIGEQMQTPPAYSAVKVRGKPLYRYARAGEAVEVAARKIRIDKIELLSLKERGLDVRVTCGRGTYVRVLAEDIGAALGTCGHLQSLRRLASGPFSIDESIGAASKSEATRPEADCR